MNKVSIVIPYFRSGKTIEKCLWHLKEQDFKDYNTCIVIDEDSVESELFIETILKKLEFNAEVKSDKVNKGACFARNLGAKNTESEYILFLDSDCYLYPGMLREMVTQIDDNSDISFVYGNYRFIDKNNMEYISKPFDPYQLETMNYINTMSLMRRESFDVVGGFIEGQKYFQDWSLFYRMSKNGLKGKWINEFIFSTNYPTEKSISGTQGLTLSEKSKLFRTEHGIDNKEIVVTTFGAPLQAIQRAKMLNADYAGVALSGKNSVFPTNLQFDNWKATYLVGCYNSDLSALENHLNICFGKRIIHFIGTDVFHLLTKHSMEEILFMKEVFSNLKCKLFANSHRLVNELKKCHIDTELLYTPIYKIERYSPLEMPKEFTIGVYYSDTNNLMTLQGDYSNIPLILEVASCLPNIKFKFFGGKIKSINGNIEFCGNIPNDKIVEFINSCSMCIRSTIHDGFPQLPIQYMLCGRPALVSCPDNEMLFADKISFEEWVKNGITIDDAKNEIINKIMDIKSRVESRTFEEMKAFSTEAKRYYSTLMSEEIFKQKIYKEINHEN